ncbi:MAG: transcription elongation factor GreA [Nitrospirae bacterium]|nr:MAG: transcription elongation factor GreA [Nitrospirota bacterium]
MSGPITRKGYEALQAELARLRKEERPKIIQAIAEAREHGDLRENAEYTFAKEQQQLIETRIQEIEAKLANSQVIDPSTLSSDTVVFGASVRLVDVATQEEKTYTLVGQEETDIKKGYISVQSPIGRALIGHRVGDVVQVNRPAGIVEYEIREIFFAES